MEGQNTQLNEDNIVIEIHHCNTCGFRTRASILAEEIYTELGLKANLIEGDIGSFDVYINGSLLFSKRETKRFPEPEEVVQKIREYMNNHKLSAIWEEQ